jgi:hypothetical protein
MHMHISPIMPTRLLCAHRCDYAHTCMYMHISAIMPTSSCIYTNAQSCLHVNVLAHKCDHAHTCMNVHISAIVTTRVCMCNKCERDQAHTCMCTQSAIVHTCFFTCKHNHVYTCVFVHKCVIMPTRICTHWRNHARSWMHTHVCMIEKHGHMLNGVHIFFDRMEGVYSG